MKAGIVTFHDSDNYGAVLQTYALQEVLKRMNVEAYVLGEKAAEAAPVKKSASPIIQRIMAKGDERHALFEQFRKAYLDIRETTPDLLESTDRFIAGSDQVWNPSITNGNPRYFLEFAPDEKRCSYAASVGESVSDSWKSLFQTKLEHFRSISVRERISVSELSELTGKDVIECLDPTLLLEKSDWEKLLTSDEEESPYLLLIMVQNDPGLYAKAMELSKARGLSRKVITASYFPPVGFEPWSGVSVNQWLTLIHNASYVITSSYHGLVFSHIFERECEICGLNGELAVRNARIDDLMSKFSCVEALRKASLSYLENLVGSQVQSDD